MFVLQHVVCVWAYVFITVHNDITSRMRVMSHDWSARKQRLHLQCSRDSPPCMHHWSTWCYTRNTLLQQQFERIRYEWRICWHLSTFLVVLLHPRSEVNKMFTKCHNDLVLTSMTQNLLANIYSNLKQSTPRSQATCQSPEIKDRLHQPVFKYRDYLRR